SFNPVTEQKTRTASQLTMQAENTKDSTSPPGGSLPEARKAVQDMLDVMNETKEKTKLPKQASHIRNSVSEPVLQNRYPEPNEPPTVLEIMDGPRVRETAAILAISTLFVLFVTFCVIKKRSK